MEKSNPAGKFETLKQSVVDFTLQRAVRQGHSLPDFRVGDRVRDRETGNMGTVFDLVTVGHVGQPLVVRVFSGGRLRTMATTRLVLVDPPARPTPPKAYA